MMYVCSYVMVGYYFEKRHPLAAGVATCGSGLGMFIIGPLTNYLIKTITWHGTMMVFAGLALNCCVLGSTFVPIHSTGAHEEAKLFDLRLMTNGRFLIFCLSSFLILIGK